MVGAHESSTKLTFKCVKVPKNGKIVSRSLGRWSPPPGKKNNPNIFNEQKLGSELASPELASCVLSGWAEVRKVAQPERALVRLIRLPLLGHSHANIIRDSKCGPWYLQVPNESLRGVKLQSNVLMRRNEPLTLTFS